MSFEDPPFVEFIKNVFSTNNQNYDDILMKLDKQLNWEMQETSHFYYYICQPDNPKAREEIQVVGITAIIERLMSKEKHITPFAYLRSIRFDNLSGNLNKIEGDYNNQFGLTRKVNDYYKNYILDLDKQQLIDGIVLLDKLDGDEIKLKNIGEFSKLLYELRSKFVHEASMFGLCPLGIDYTVYCSGVHDPILYSPKINIKPLLKIFERSFVNYWNKVSQRA